jgi:hypothetical protein
MWREIVQCEADSLLNSCVVVAGITRHSDLKQSRIRSAVFGNSRQFFIMRQNDRADLDDMGMAHSRI